MKYTILLLVLCAGARVASADEPTPAPLAPEPEAAPAPPPSVEAQAEPPGRKGFFAGGAFGLGSVKLSCDGIGCGHYAGVGFSVDGGYAFAPKFAVVGEIWFTGGISNADSKAAGQLWTFSANLRYWLFDRFWMEGGLGVTGFDLLQDGKNMPVASGGGGGLILGAGAELWRAPGGHLVVDLRVKLGLMSVKDQSLGKLNDDSIGTRQTTAMVTLSYY